MRFIKAATEILKKQKLCVVWEENIPIGEQAWCEVWEDDGIVMEYCHLQCKGEEKYLVSDCG